jgi:DNA excision repair protein ERCC-4
MARNNSLLPAELRAEDVTAICDTREQTPIDLAPLKVITGTLPTGDYSVLGLEHVIAIERKSAGDMLACIGQERERFDREIQRLLAYPTRGIVCEASWQFFERGEWRGKVTANAAIGSLLGWVAAGVPIVMADDHERAGRFIGRLLYTAARRRWRELRALHAGVVRGDEIPELCDRAEPT